MIRNSVVGLTVCILICLAGAVAWAQQESAAELYGRGVSAYFSGDSVQAIALLDKAIKANPDDPRALYFRGLAITQQNGVDAAKADFAKAAEIEATARTHVYDVDDALQRIQGSLRIEIENQRRTARQAALERKRKQDQVRYEALQRAEKDVLFDPNRPAPKIDFPITKPKIAIDPFASGLALTGGKQVAVKTAPAVPSTASGPKPRDPFAAPGSSPAAKTEDPFGAPTGTKSLPAPKAPAPQPAANPFGDMTPAPAAKPPAPTTTGGGAKKAPEDPFGVVAAAPPNTAPAATGTPTTTSPPSKPATSSSASGVVGSVVDLMGKTLSGKNSARDPFGGAATPAPKNDTAKKKTDADPLETSPAPKTDPGKQRPAAKKPATPPADDPFK